jgi:hypothetical protein
VNVHVQKKAYIYWQHGKDQVGDVATYSNDAIADIFIAQDRRSNPSKYQLMYGKAQQAGFITNFRDILVQNDVFKDVELTADPAISKANDVLISLYFKSTRVADIENNYQIMLTMEMKITSGKSTFTRTYMADSDKGTLFNGKSYNEQIIDVSEKMIKQLMSGIKNWSHTN